MCTSVHTKCISFALGLSSQVHNSQMTWVHLLRDRTLGKLRDHLKKRFLPSWVLNTLQMTQMMRNDEHSVKFNDRHQCGSSQAIRMTVMWGAGSQPVWDFDPWCNPTLNQISSPLSMSTIQGPFHNTNRNDSRKVKVNKSIPDVTHCPAMAFVFICWQTIFELSELSLM